MVLPWPRGRRTTDSRSGPLTARQIRFWNGSSSSPQSAAKLSEVHALCGWYFYVALGFSDELSAYQLGHSDAKLVRDLYGHGRADALARLKQGKRVQVRPIRATSLPHAVAESA
jgi:hypothetical protein